MSLFGGNFRLFTLLIIDVTLSLNFDFIWLTNWFFKPHNKLSLWIANSSAGVNQPTNQINPQKSCLENIFDKGIETVKGGNLQNQIITEKIITESEPLTQQSGTINSAMDEIKQLVKNDKKTVDK